MIKKEFDIDIDDETLKLKYKTKLSFKKFLKSKSKQLAIVYLNELKSKHSKLDKIHFTDLKCSQYLVDQRISHKEAKLLFNLRTRMYRVKCNFKNEFNFNILCDLCKSAICDQRHLLSCSVLKSNMPELDSTTVRYHHLFGDIEKMIPAIKLFSQITERREELLQKLQEVKLAAANSSQN